MADRTLIPADPELWRRTGHAYPACTADACRSGRAPCPCPNDCRLPEADDRRPFAAVVLRAFWFVVDRLFGDADTPAREQQARVWRLYAAGLIVALIAAAAVMLPNT